MAVNPTHGKAAIWGICVYHRLIIFDNAFGRHIFQKLLLAVIGESTIWTPLRFIIRNLKSSSSGGTCSSEAAWKKTYLR